MARTSDLEFRLQRARRLEDARLKKRWTRSKLSEEAGYDEKTVRNVLTGNSVRDQTIMDISQALDVEPELVNENLDVDFADDIYGGYLRKTHRYYESYFRLFRRSFSDSTRIFSTIVEILWNDDLGRLVFREFFGLNEENQPRYHEGSVYLSSYTNLMHLVTIYEGSVRARLKSS